MLMRIKNHFKNHSGDANVSRMTLIAIVFVVGAILLVLTTSAFRNPINRWFETVTKDWFADDNGMYEADNPFLYLEKNENGTYKGLNYRLDVGNGDYWYIDDPDALINGQSSANVHLTMELLGNPVFGYAPFDATVEISADGKTITMGDWVFEAYLPK